MQEFATIITPRLYETDAMGHINNATIAAWFEVVLVHIEPQSKTPTRIPDTFRDKVAAL